VPSASLLAPRIDWLSLVGGRPQRPRSLCRRDVLSAA
jgi:hypothetical protein